MRAIAIIILFGLVAFVYSFVGNAHLDLYWTDVVQAAKPDVQYDKIYFALYKDWLVIRWIGGITFVLGIVVLLIERRK
jgi:hypothetical protein